MNLDKENLYRISDAANAVGISRRMLLNYEECGLVTPDYKDESSGYRYYSADSIYHIKLIRTLQQLGLSLAEIADYNKSPLTATTYIARLTSLRDTLDQSLRTLKQRVGRTEEIEWVTLERRVCVSCTYPYSNTQQAVKQLRETCNRAIAAGMRLSACSKLFSQPFDDGLDRPGITFFVPVDETTATSECVVCPSTAAICCFHHGSYEELPEVRAKLLEYASSNGIEILGPPQSIYLEGPPTHKDNTGSYITMVALPVQERRRSGTQPQ